LLQRDDRDVIAGLELPAKPLDASPLFPLDLLGRLVDTLFQQSRWGRGVLGGAFELDALEDGAAVVVGGDDAGDAGLRALEEMELASLAVCARRGVLMVRWDD